MTSVPLKNNKETVESYLARGGAITKVPSISKLNEEQKKQLLEKLKHGNNIL